MIKKQLFTSLLVLVTLAGLIAATFYFYLFGMREPVSVAEEFVLKKSAVVPEKLGELFMVGHWANTPAASTTELIKKYRIGGIIIMSAPEDTNEIKTWTKEWQAASTFPLLIAIDQEGGPVTRLRSAAFVQTGQREISDVETAYAIGKRRGEELAALGINMNFAPVLDTANNPKSFMYGRVFPGNEPTLAVAMTRGMAEGGVIAVSKHFPGHDDTDDDSHLTLPTVLLEKADLDEFTKPFLSYIQMASPLALMTAHVLFPKIDDVPATLSSFFLTDYLRGTLGFTGLIITDDMSMDAIDTTFTAGEASLLSLEAGADMVLFAAEPKMLEEALPIVKAGISNTSYTRAVQHNDAIRAKLMTY